MEPKLIVAGIDVHKKMLAVVQTRTTHSRCGSSGSLPLMGAI
jgi:hypothetical protein